MAAEVGHERGQWRCESVAAHIRARNIRVGGGQAGALLDIPLAAPFRLHRRPAHRLLRVPRPSTPPPLTPSLADRCAWRPRLPSMHLQRPVAQVNPPGESAGGACRSGLGSTLQVLSSASPVRFRSQPWRHHCCRRRLPGTIPTAAHSGGARPQVAWRHLSRHSRDSALATPRQVLPPVTCRCSHTLRRRWT